MVSSVILYHLDHPDYSSQRPSRIRCISWRYLLSMFRHWETKSPALPRKADIQSSHFRRWGCLTALSRKACVSMESVSVCALSFCLEYFAQEHVYSIHTALSYPGLYTFRWHVPSCWNPCSLHRIVHPSWWGELWGCTFIQTVQICEHSEHAQGKQWRNCKGKCNCDKPHISGLQPWKKSMVRRLSFVWALSSK